jgi:hypothetical protein
MKDFITYTVEEVWERSSSESCSVSFLTKIDKRVRVEVITLIVRYNEQSLFPSQ